MTEDLTDFQRGLKEGRVDALLEEHTLRLNKINGSVERFAKSNEVLVKAMRDMHEKLDTKLRNIEEQMRLDAERVKVAADTLAAETERRREELATSLATTSTTWSLRSNKASVVYVFVAFVSVVTAIYLAVNPIH